MLSRPQLDASLSCLVVDIGLASDMMGMQESSARCVTASPAEGSRREGVRDSSPSLHQFFVFRL